MISCTGCGPLLAQPISNSHATSAASRIVAAIAMERGVITSDARRGRR